MCCHFCFFREFDALLRASQWMWVQAVQIFLHGLQIPCSIAAENDISRYPQTYRWGFISHKAAGLPNALVRTSPQAKQVHALLTPLLHTSTLALLLLLLALAVLLRPLYVLKVAQPIVKKGENLLPALYASPRFFALLCSPNGPGSTRGQ